MTPLLEPAKAPMKDSHLEPGPSAQFKLTFRKDLFEEKTPTINPTSTNIKDSETHCDSNDIMELSENDSIKDPPVPPNEEGDLPSKTVKVVPTSAHDDCNGNELREVVPTPPGKLLQLTCLRILSCDDVWQHSRHSFWVVFTCSVSKNI